MLQSAHVQKSKQTVGLPLHREVSIALGLRRSQHKAIGALPEPALKAVLDFMAEMSSARFFEPAVAQESDDSRMGRSWADALLRGNERVDRLAEAVEVKTGRKADIRDYRVIDDADKRVRDSLESYDVRYGNINTAEALGIIREAVGKTAYDLVMHAIVSKHVFMPDQRLQIGIAVTGAEKAAMMAVSYAFAESLGHNIDGSEFLRGPWEAWKTGVMPLGYMDGRLVTVCRSDNAELMRLKR